MVIEKRKLVRRKVYYYLPVTEPGTSRVLGVVMDISPEGFKLDSEAKVLMGEVRRFYIHLPDEIAPQAARLFTGRSRWCHPDYVDPFSFTIGYEFLNISEDNAAFFQRLFDTYGTKSTEGGEYNAPDYFWK
jgi:hypothetical protein